MSCVQSSVPSVSLASGGGCDYRGNLFDISILPLVTLLSNGYLQLPVLLLSGRVGQL